MKQPVKVSDDLLIAARLSAEATQRSIAGQIEFWARLGQAMEASLTGAQAVALRRAGKAQSLQDALASVDSDEGRRRVIDYLQQRPFPHYEAAPGRPGFLVREDEDGTRSIGRFVGRVFKVDA